MAFTQEDRDAFQKIKRLLREEPPTNWDLPDDYAAKAFEIANLAVVSPARALAEADKFIASLINKNLDRQTKLQKARKLKADLADLKKGKPADKRLGQGRNQNVLAEKIAVEKAAEDAKKEQRLKRILKIKLGVTQQPTIPKPTPALSKRTIDSTADVIISDAADTQETSAEVQIIPPEPDPVEDHGFSLPITNAGARGLIGYIQRWFLSVLNGTPTQSLNWMEVTADGLQIYQPLATVSQRTVKHRQLTAGQFVLSVDPPAYFDSILGLLKQFRTNIDTPWGEVVLYEGGSGRVIASAIARWPAAKVKEIRAALELLHLAENEAEGFQRIPRLRDMFSYFDPDIIGDVNTMDKIDSLGTEQGS